MAARLCKLIKMEMDGREVFRMANFKKAQSFYCNSCFKDFEQGELVYFYQTRKHYYCHDCADDQKDRKLETHIYQDLKKEM
ncbi:hypothetical protein ACFPU1_04300 [Thalassorhabdus alkalitolerans]|uniref:Uncharacterized protein n=1 Tax=Thalassorhabdus alkalitolerans TaxID=2282697 RepID=A0ABW0YNN3_9BACI